MKTTDTLPRESPAQKFVWMERISALMDDQFRIPFTKIRFGLDFVVGLFPYVGDIVGFMVSALLVTTMARYGASGKVLVLMLWNVLLDTVVGGIPILGDWFDLRYRANRRNFDLLKRHYVEGAHQGSAWPAVLLVLAVFIGLLVALIYLIWRFLDWIVDSFSSLL
ncbi:MAG: DUF4112 domain-containing protein [Phaeodactylibacter sp.]|nr:DUF4112 domain-containing protein [Phaeodactylibacter sp.]